MIRCSIYVSNVSGFRITHKICKKKEVKNGTLLELSGTNIGKIIIFHMKFTLTEVVYLLTRQKKKPKCFSCSISVLPEVLHKTIRGVCEMSTSFRL